jgi:uncharacterized membrane protein YfcA
MEWYSYILVGLAAMAAGLVNALAGGGTLITFPMLTAVGIPAVAANVTNTVALCPGYLGATLASMKDIREQKQRLWLFIPTAVVGGLVGGFLLLNTGEKLFRQLVPFLILAASLLLAISDPLRAWMLRRIGNGKGGSSAATKAASAASVAAWGILPVGLAAVYGGYFGAGVSVIILAVLGLVLGDSLTKLNALKQASAFSTNIAAAVFFLFSGNVVWPAALVMMACALVGGSLGGRLAGRIKPSTLRWMVVVIGVVVAGYYFIRG